MICSSIMSKMDMIPPVFWIISGVLVFQESPYWLWSILTVLIALLIPIIEGILDMSGWLSDRSTGLFSNEKITIKFKLD